MLISCNNLDMISIGYNYIVHNIRHFNRMAVVIDIKPHDRISQQIVSVYCWLSESFTFNF